MCAPFTRARAPKSQTISLYRAMALLGSPSCSLFTTHQPLKRTCFAHLAIRYLLFFHANTNCLFCNPFVLITMQIAGGVGVSPEGVGVKVLLEVTTFVTPHPASPRAGTAFRPFSRISDLCSLPTVSCALSAVDSPKFFRMRSSKISTVKSFRMRSCKNVPA